METDSKSINQEKPVTPPPSPEPKASADADAEKPIETAQAEQAEPPPPVAKKRRGFAGMDLARVREIARRGGVAAHAKGAAHRFTSDEARQAGKKGGEAPHRFRGRKRTDETGVPPQGS